MAERTTTESDRLWLTDGVTDREQAISRVFRNHSADLVRLAYCLLGDREAAEEAVQEAFLSLYRQWNSLRDHAALLSYLRAAVVNGCRSRQRHLVRVRRSPLWLADVPEPVPGADYDALAHDEALRMAAAIRRLSTRQREVVVCRYYLDLTEAQTASLLDVSVGSVKRHAHRALANLHDQLEVAP